MLVAPDKVPYTEGFAERMANMYAAPYLDVHVCDHCNLRCAGCLHFAPLAEQRFLDLDEYARDLEQLAAVRGIAGYFDTIVLMGGEPLLHPRVAEVVRTTRAHLPNENIDLCKQYGVKGAPTLVITDGENFQSFYSVPEIKKYIASL